MVHRSIRASLTLVSVSAVAQPFAHQPGIQVPVSIPTKPPVFHRANELLPEWCRDLLDHQAHQSRSSALDTVLHREVRID